MKKLVVLFLSICMTFSCTNIAFASETVLDEAEWSTTMSEVLAEAEARNTELWHTQGTMIFSGYYVIKVRPGAGVKLCAYFYKTGGGLRIQVREEGKLTWSSPITMEDSGHNWATLVNNTKDVVYEVRLHGEVAEINGGIYTE